MPPDDPRRLRPRESALTLVAPAPPGMHDGDPAGHDPAPPRDHAGETSDQRAYTWLQHWDYGLLREDPPGGFSWEAWCKPEHGWPGLWHTITFDPFSDSYSEISEAMAKELIGDGDLYGPTEDERYKRETAINMAR